LVNAIFRRPGGPEMGATFPTLFDPRNASWLRTFWDGPLAVAHVGVWRGQLWTHGARLAVAHIGAVCTRPEYRGRGLASALLWDALALLRAEGVALVLISGDRSLYRRAGARRFGRLLRYRVGAELLASLQLPRVRTAAPTPEALAGLYAREPLHYERSGEDWRRLLVAKGYLPPSQGRGGAVGVWRNGTDGPVAYLLLGKADRPDGGSAVLRVDEFAGDRAAVLAALPSALAAAGAERAELLVQPGDAALRALLEPAAGPPEVVPHQGTGRVLDFAACASALDVDLPLPPYPLGDPREAEEAGRWMEEVFSLRGRELPRNDGLQYI
jgi:GNAT superfamily N-acetyltransferase